jgi:hypothetical protein
MGYIGWRERKHLAPAALPAPAETIDPTVVRPTDPRLSVSIVHLKEGGMAAALGIVLTNVGGAEAHILRLSAMIAGRYEIEFPDNIPMLDPSESTHPLVATIKSFGPLLQHDLTRVFMEGWDNQPKGMVGILYYPAEATYEDFAGTKFKASWNYEFRPFIYTLADSLNKSGNESFIPDTHGPYIVVSSVKTEKI